MWRLLLLYLTIMFGPVLVLALVWALRDRLTRRQAMPPPGDGHAQPQRLEQTEEVRP